MGIKYIEHVNGTATPDKIAVEYAIRDSAGNIIKDTYLKTWRPIKYGNTTLNDAATTLEFVAGSNISLSFGSGKLTIGATDTTYGGDRGISLVSGNFGHSNTAVTAITTAGFYKVKYDTYGHITGTAAVQSSDISGLESDPVFSASAAAEITSTDITNWNSKTSNTGTVIGSGLTAEYFVVGNSTVNVKISSMRPSTSSTTWSATSDVYVPTMKAISSYVTGLGYTTNTGTVTSVQVQASDPLQSSTSTAQSSSLSTTISFKNQNANVVLAGPSSGSTAAAPTFRSLVAADIPSLTASKISDFTSTARSTISGTSPISYNSSTGAITHATALSSAASSGLYKVAVNTYGHVTSATAVGKADITALGIPGSDTNDAVTQTATTTSAAYEVLFSETADNTTRTEGARKNNNLTYNPSTGNISTVIYTMMTGTTAKAQMAYDSTEDAVKFTFV